MRFLSCPPVVPKVVPKTGEVSFLDSLQRFGRENAGGDHRRRAGDPELIHSQIAHQTIVAARAILIWPPAKAVDRAAATSVSYFLPAKDWMYSIATPGSMAVW